MPKMNGAELIREIRVLDQSVPIIMLSGYVEALGLTESNTGADLVLTKSANEVTHLVRAVSRLLRLKATKKVTEKIVEGLREGYAEDVTKKENPDN
jgi:CheY-like chemotaxis protein